VLQIFLGALLLCGNAFFVGAEFALVSVRRSQIEPAAENGHRRARTVLHALENVSAMLAAAQLGITACSLLLGAVAEPTAAHLMGIPLHEAGVPQTLIHPIAYVVALAVVVFLHMVGGEMVPKNIALVSPEKAALWLGPPLFAVARALRPVIQCLNLFAGLVLRLFRVEPKDEVESVFTNEQLAHLVEDSRQAGLLGPGQQRRLEDALELGRRSVTEVLLPTDTLVTVEAGVTPRRIEELAVRTGFSRFPVIDSKGTFLGYLHLKDMLDLEERDAPVPRQLWRRITVVRDRLPLDDALTAMRRAASHLAAVVGSDGRTLGLVTMEDVLEKLVGEVHDPAHRRQIAAL
jgi:CBS domain containing-hemolysin-like protein